MSEINDKKVKELRYSTKYVQSLDEVKDGVNMKNSPDSSINTLKSKLVGYFNLNGSVQD